MEDEEQLFGGFLFTVLAVIVQMLFQLLQTQEWPRISAPCVSAQREEPGPEAMPVLQARGVLAACPHRSGLVHPREGDSSRITTAAVSRQQPW